MNIPELILALLGGGLLLFVLYIYIQVCWLVFKLSYKHYQDKEFLAQKYNFPNAEQVTLKNSNNLTLDALYIPVPKPKAVILLIHGFTNPEGFSGKSFMLHHAQYLQSAGYSTFLVSLSSFGASQGKKVTFGINEWQDVDTAFAYVKSREENKGLKIGLFGNSMGATTAIIAASKIPVDFVIAVAPFASILSVIKKMSGEKSKIPFFILKPVIWLALLTIFGPRFSRTTAERSIQSVHAPILIITAKRDQNIHPLDGVNLFKLANNPKEFESIDSGHDIFAERADEARTKILKFLHYYVR